MNEETDCLEEIEKYYAKIFPFIADYGVRKINFNKLVKKLNKKTPELHRLLLAFFIDLNKVHERIQNIINAPLARTPGYWENYKIMFTSGHDREKLPELDTLITLKKQFRILVAGFYKHNRHHYVKSKKINVETSPQSDSGNQV